MRAITLFAIMALIGCGPPLPMSERRSISYEYPCAGYSDVEYSCGGAVLKRRYLVVHWNIRHDSGKSTHKALEECIAALRTEGRTDIARRIGLRELSMDYVAFLVYRDKKDMIGTYEFGLLVSISAVFSGKSLEELIEIGRSTPSPVGMTADGKWDFGWSSEQVVAAYQEDCVQ
jgi:hypothetical protein